MAPARSFVSVTLLLLLSLFTAFSSAQSIAITGATGGVQPRLEIRQMFRDDPTQWNLYLLALRQFQGNQPSFITSWFQIGGIHGSPQVAWDGVQQSGPGVGYCTHSSNLFPCWHRPYLGLFEQKLQQAAVYVAQQFPAGNVRNANLAAANTMRLPYWDWAAAPPNGNPTLPLVVSQKYVTVQSPTGAQTIINPLFRYDFHDQNEAEAFSPYGAPFNQWPMTYRYPTTTQPGAVSQNNIAQSTLDNNRVSQRQSLYNWFTLCPTYDEISNDQPSGSSSSCHISLESLHNNIHVWVGGSNDGHMTIVPVSAFDPTFMLHHAMIDRLFAMWQAIYPNSYITNEASQIDTFTINKGSVQGPNSPLTPFHKNTQGDFWTCAASRSTSTFNYVYADAQGTSANVRNAVNRLYGPNASATAGSSRMRKRDAMPAPKSSQAGSLSSASPTSNASGTSVALSSAAAPSIVASSASSPSASPSGLLGGTVTGNPLSGVLSVPSKVTTATNGSTFQYIANIQTTRFKLDGSYTVFMFFGDPDQEVPTTWSRDTNMVGSYGVFSMPGMTGSDLVTTSTVPLTDALTNVVAKKTRLSGPLLTALSQPLIIPFLQKNLHWRVAKSDGTVVEPEDIPDFKVSVVSSTMTQPESDDDFPTWSEFNVLTQITRGKKGGVEKRQDLHLLGKRNHLYEGVRHPTNLHEEVDVEDDEKYYD